MMRVGVSRLANIQKLQQTVKHAPKKVHLEMDSNQKKLYPQVEQEFTEEGYPILKLVPSKRNIFSERTREPRKRNVKFAIKSREETMKEDQDWPSIWPTAKTFTPSAVPLPLRQGYESKPNKAPRAKYANTELQKVANFLHLTPVAIERHCKALKKFCTTWPEALESDDDVRAHFPVTYITRDFVHSSPNLRDSRARVVELKINLEDLKLNARERDKIIRLANHRYDQHSGLVTITADACPVRIQNKDYSDYLLTALYFESLRYENWEDDKPECDWERFFWEKSESKAKAKTYLSVTNSSVKGEVFEKGTGEPVIEQYKKSLEDIYDKENYENLEAYRSSVEKLLGFNKVHQVLEER